MNRHYRENGQIAVMMVLSIVAIIGFAALAIDGGMIYADRRNAQNVADASSLAGALSIVKGNKVISTVKSAAFARAAADGFDNDTTSNIVTVNYPYDGSSNYIEVIIQSKVDTSLVNVVYSGEIWNTVESVAHVIEDGPIFEGQALVSTSPHANPGIDFNGNGQIKITGGGIFSNSDANTPPSSISANKGATSGSVHVDGGSVSSVGYFREQPAGTIYPSPVAGAEPQGLPPVPEPVCGSPVNDPKVQPSQTKTIDPGTFKSITNKGHLLLKPGFYCLEGDFKSNGGIVEVDGPSPVPGSPTPGVFIFMKSGLFDLGGNTDVKLWAPMPNQVVLTTTDGEKQYDYAGMLIYASPTNSNVVYITGGSTVNYTGTIYAPASTCNVGGNSGNVGLLSSQVICDTIKTFGTAEIDINYDDSFLHIVPPAIESFH
ncbi:MAG: Tad domain-containing protein [Chloroflexi bacterium]|nr:Tad domain-containing protein [Chloroflexota bacterium]